MDSDDELVLRAIQGDFRTFDELYTKHQAAITRYCRCLLPNAQESEDAAQETFGLAWKHLSSFRGEGQFESWLKRIATRVCQRRWRTKSGRDSLHHPSIDLLELTDERDGGVDEAVTRVYAQQIVCRILECGRDADPRWDALDLDIFVLYCSEGIKVKREVARLLGEPEGKIKYRISKHIDPVIERVYWEFEGGNRSV